MRHLAKTHCRLPGAGLLLGLLAALTASPALAQTDLGGQRVATSSATFLKIGLDARAAALGGAYNALASGPNAIFYNPAGLIDDGHTESLAMSFAQWPAEVNLGSISASRDVASLGSRIGVGLIFLGTSFDETTEFHPLGTGRSVSYSDLAVSLGFSRHFTDRLAIGASVKYIREDLGSNLDGPVMNGVLLDAGTVYSLANRNARLAITLNHFGPDLRPDGSFSSRVTGSEIEYSAFSPPTQFQLGFSLDPWTRGMQRLTTAGQVMHQADNAETIRTGLEYHYGERMALRAGYDWSSDEMGFSAGLGVKVDLLGRLGAIDYAVTEGGNLETVHRWTVGFGL
ncbi:MAG: PorV/PorQ family protein [Candidatus Eisenbacteria bacterium]|nr:PorV/PorQ family protein [Candidatus Eisenbacteria bacterium]MCC7141673.1 PorV/PorQ family protein [Candidatus Eisenbacteria bacterium]